MRKTIDRPCSICGEMMHNVDTQRKTHVQCSYVRELEKSAKRKKKNISSLSYYGENGYIMKYLRETAQTSYRVFTQPTASRGCHEGRFRNGFGDIERQTNQSAMMSLAGSLARHPHKN